MPRKNKEREEEKYYPVIKEKLSELFKEKGVGIHLEITDLC